MSSAAPWRESSGSCYCRARPERGKSRLGRELLRRHREVTGLVAQGYPLAASAAFGLWTEAVDPFLQSLPDAEVVRALRRAARRSGEPVSPRRARSRRASRAGSAASPPAAGSRRPARQRLAADSARGAARRRALRRSVVVGGVALFRPASRRRPAAGHRDEPSGRAGGSRHRRAGAVRARAGRAAVACGRRAAGARGNGRAGRGGHRAPAAQPRWSTGSPSDHRAIRCSRSGCCAR